MLTHVTKSLNVILRAITGSTTKQLVLARVPVRAALISAMFLGSAFIGGARVGFAQDSMANGPPGGFYRSGPPSFNVEHGFYQHHSSTAAEGFLRGMAALKQANGLQRKHEAEAMILEEQAEWLDYENKEKRVETFYARREERQRYMSEQSEIAQVRDIEGKKLLNDRRATEYRAAYRLKLEEFNRNNGLISWHPVLLAGFFNEHSQKLNFLFKQRAEYSLENDRMLVDEILATLGDFEKCLRDNRDLFSPRDHAEAQDFLRGLFYEVSYPPTVG